MFDEVTVACEAYVVALSCAKRYVNLIRKDRHAHTHTHTNKQANGHKSKQRHKHASKHRNMHKHECEIVELCKKRATYGTCCFITS